MSGIWPDDTRCVAVLSFDVDGVSGSINRNPDATKFPSLISMREYGPNVGAPRILDLLDTYDIKASFYVPGYIAETHVPLMEDILKRGHELAHHGYMHEPPATLTREEEEQVLDRGIEVLQRISGEPPKGYRSPSWELSEHSLGLLADRGFLYDSSLMGNDIPYMVDAGQRQLVEVPIHWELDDAPYFVYVPSEGRRNVQASPEHVYEVWSAAFEGIYHYGRSFVLTMHPFVIGRPGRLRMLERLIRYMREFPGVRFMRAVDLAQEWTDREARVSAPQTPRRQQTSFYVYENKPFKRATVHKGSCGFCKYGSGVAGRGSTQSGEWHGPLETRASADQVARDTGRNVRDCQFCFPHSRSL